MKETNTNEKTVAKKSKKWLCNFGLVVGRIIVIMIILVLVFLTKVLLSFSEVGFFSVSGVRFLVFVGADVNATNDDGMTVLMLAAEHNTNPKVITELIKGGADVNAKDNSSRTALMLTARRGDYMLAKTLLKGGANVDAKDFEGKTALMHAALKNSNPGLIDALIKGGSDINEKDNEGCTALDYAYNENYTGRKKDIYGFLVKKGAKFGSELK